MKFWGPQVPPEQRTFNAQLVEDVYRTLTATKYGALKLNYFKHVVPTFLALQAGLSWRWNTANTLKIVFGLILNQQR